MINNYRPVSVLPAFSKIYERVFYKRLLSYINVNNLLYNHQYGFRAGHSTGLALTVLVDRIIESLDSSKSTVGVFLDFSKAFDTVNHNILLSKLETYGVRGAPLSWIASYLSCRTQYVNYNKTSSSSLPIACGVPQGSILGPLLFLIYINDMVNVSQSLFYVLFADDSNAFLSGKNIDQVICDINVALVDLVEWLNTNKLTLNIKKTQFIIFKSPKCTQTITKRSLLMAKTLTGWRALVSWVLCWTVALTLSLTSHTFERRCLRVYIFLEEHENSSTLPLLKTYITPLYIPIFPTVMRCGGIHAKHTMIL